MGRRVASRLGAALAIALAFGLPEPTLGQSGAAAHERGCRQGIAASCALLAVAFETGATGDRDPERAAALHQSACEGGISTSCTSLGVMYQTGVGVPLDLPRARQLFEIACGRGESEACELGRTLADSEAPAQLTSLRVVDRDGQPLAEALVEVPALSVVAVSDRSGRVDLGLVPVGAHELRVERLGYATLAGTLDVEQSGELTIVMAEAAAGDLARPGQVVGRVTDADSGEGLSEVQISLEGTTAGTLSGVNGSFSLRGVEPGLRRLRFERIGHGTETALVIVQPGAVVEIAASLSTEAIELDPVSVLVGTAFDRRAFDARARGGWGTHFSPEELDRIRPQRVSDVIRGRVRGITTVTDFLGTRVVSRRSVSGMSDSLTAARRMGPAADSSDVRAYMSNAQYCSLSIYLDGMEVQNFDIDALDTRSIDAIEIYHGLGTPIQYLANRCGAVLIWTGRGR